MLDPILLVLTEIILRQAPTWFYAIQESLFSKANDIALSKGKSFTVYDKKHLQHLELALKNATERGLASFHSVEEQNQFRSIIQVLSESSSEGIAGEAAKLFTIEDEPNLVLLSEKYNLLQRIRALGQNEPFVDIDATAYLSSFFKALVIELYNDPLFHERVSDVIKVRAALREQHTISLTVHIEQQEIFMGDKVEGNKPTYSIGDITNATVSGVIQGENNTVISNLNASGKTELAETLKALTDAVMASKDLPVDQKEEQVKVINQLGEEAAKPKPNKTLLKILADGLLTALKAIPDIATAVAAAAPILTQLHL